MTIDARLADIARGILSHTIRPDDVPTYDRAEVQAILVMWWLERDVLKRRISGTTPTRTPPARPNS